MAGRVRSEVGWFLAECGHGFNAHQKGE